MRITIHRGLYRPALPNRDHPQAGFTLIEIMVVIAIIGILATLIVPKIMGRPDEARVTAAKHDLATISQALKLYRLDIGRYPTTEQGLKALVERPSSEPVPQNWKNGGYLDRLPNDPWGNPYIVTLDLNGDGKARDGFYSLAAPNNGTPNGLTETRPGIFELNAPVMAWSFGPDSKANATQNTAKGTDNFDNILSWKDTKN